MISRQRSVDCRVPGRRDNEKYSSCEARQHIHQADRNRWRKSSINLLDHWTTYPCPRVTVKYRYGIRGTRVRGCTYAVACDWIVDAWPHTLTPIRSLRAHCIHSAIIESIESIDRSMIDGQILYCSAMFGHFSPAPEKTDSAVLI